MHSELFPGCIPEEAKINTFRTQVQCFCKKKKDRGKSRSTDSSSLLSESEKVQLLKCTESIKVKSRPLKDISIGYFCPNLTFSPWSTLSLLLFYYILYVVFSVLVFFIICLYIFFFFWSSYVVFHLKYFSSHYIFFCLVSYVIFV